jgi:hypothetical protein
LALDELRGKIHSPADLAAGKKAPDAHRIEGSVGYRIGLDALGKRRITLHCRKSNSDLSVVQPVTYSKYRLIYEQK